jgi:hypothetical protein
MKANIICTGICHKTKSASAFDNKDGVCKECSKETARRGLIQCEFGNEFKPQSEFIEPGLCKECKMAQENWFDYYCDKDHCRELDIKEIGEWLHSLSNSDGSSGNDTEITHLIRHLMVFILYRMHCKDAPMDLNGIPGDFVATCRDVAEHVERLQSEKGENVVRTESMYERNKAADEEEMNINPKDKCSHCLTTEGVELVYKQTWKERKKDEPLCECFGTRKGCTFTSIVFPNSEKSWITDKGSLYDREGDVRFVLHTATKI